MNSIESFWSGGRYDSVLKFAGMEKILFFLDSSQTAYQRSGMSVQNDIYAFSKIAYFQIK